MLNVKMWEPVTYKVGDTELQFKVKRLNFTAGKQFRLTVARCGYDDLIRAMQLEGKAQLAIATRAAALLRGELERAARPIPLVTPAEDVDAKVRAYTEAVRAADLVVPEFDPAEQKALLESVREAERAQADAMERFFDRLDDGFVEDLFTTKVKDVEGLAIDGETTTTGAELLEVADQLLTIFTMQAVLNFCRLSEAEKNASPSPSTSAQEAETVDGRSTAAPAGCADGPLLETATAIPVAAT